VPIPLAIGHSRDYQIIDIDVEKDAFLDTWEVGQGKYVQRLSEHAS
jgi:hypothetical protein